MIGLRNRADGCDGSYCIEKTEGNVTQYWNTATGGWSAFASVFTLREAEVIQELLQQLDKQNALIKKYESAYKKVDSHATRGCNHFCDWYSHGLSCNAGTVAYDLYSDLRMVLKEIRK